MPHGPGPADLAEVIFRMLGVRVDDDDFPDVLFSDFIVGVGKTRSFRNSQRWCGTVHVDGGSGNTRHHGYRQDDFEHVPVGGAPRGAPAQSGAAQTAFIHAQTSPCAGWKS